MKYFVVFLLLISLIATGELNAQATSSDKKYHFSIPRQQADLSLTQIAEQANITLIFPFDKVKTRTANQVYGFYTVTEGLDILLHGTGLRSLEKNNGRISIVLTKPQEGIDIMHRLNKLSASMVAITSSVFTATGLMAQENQPTHEQELEELIVISTGTAVGRVEADVPQAITSFSEDKLRRLTANSQADILRSVPGIKVEGGGGEVAVNLRVRGLPSAGQFQFTPLQYDGIPVFNTFGLNSSSFDVLFRTDLGIQRLEFARGGVSNLFGSSSVAGVINYISKNGQDDPGNVLQLEVAEEGRVRADFYTGGAINDSTFYALSGFYRTDDGPVDSGNETKGGQIRGNIKYVFDSGSLTLSAQLIDDAAQFIGGLPLDSTSLERPKGNNGQTIYTLQNPGVGNFQYNTPAGLYSVRSTEGVTAEGGFLALAYEQDLGNDWQLNSKVKVADYDHEFNIFDNNDGITSTPLTPSAYLAAIGNLGEISGAQFINVRTGQEVNGNSFVYGNRVTDRNRPADEVTAEFSLTKSFDVGNTNHNVTFGLFYADSEAGDLNYRQNYLTEFNSRPDLIHVTYTDPVTGQQLIYADNGLIGGNITSDNRISSKRTAFYLTDQIETDKWVFDLGLRAEEQEGDIFRTNFASTPFNITGKPNVGPNLLSTNAATGTESAQVTESDVGFSAAALYRINDSLNVYANASQGFFFPQLRSVSINNNQPDPYEAESIDQFEIGLKYSADNFNGAIALFKTDLSNRISVDNVNDPNNPGAVITSVSRQSTEAEGIEGFFEYNISDYWSIDGTILYQDHEFTQDESTPTNVGNEISRLPNTVINLGAFYDNDIIDFGLYVTHQGDAFGNDANSDVLESYEVWRLNAGYTMQLEDERELRFGLDVFNLGDSQGLAEANPRAGNNSSAAGAFFIGRPILPRRVSFKLTYDF